MSTATAKEVRFRVTFKGESFFENATTGLIALQRVHARLLKREADTKHTASVHGLEYEIDADLGSFVRFKELANFKESLRW